MNVLSDGYEYIFNEVNGNEQSMVSEYIGRRDGQGGRRLGWSRVESHLLARKVPAGSDDFCTDHVNEHSAAPQCISLRPGSLNQWNALNLQGNNFRVSPTLRTKTA